MKYNFDEIIERKNTNSVKYDELEAVFGTDNLLPMWVADMDFKTAKPIRESIIKKAREGVYGYTSFPGSYYRVFQDWLNRRHDWEINTDWVVHSPGVVPALSIIVNNFTEPGDKVIIQPPVYKPFFEVVQKNNRKLVKNPLKQVNDKYVMDFEDLKSKIDNKVEMLILCSPHNPVGRVWNREELKELGQICIENDILIVADEIHQDLIYRGNKHIPFASISKDFAYNSITCTAPSKTFNIPGLKTSFVILPREENLLKFKESMDILHLSRNNTFGLVAAEAAYREGEEWLEQLLDYLYQNLHFLVNYFEERISGIEPIIPEGTYLVWLDCTKIDLTSEELDKLMIEEAGVALDPGHWFGKSGKGYMRINIACPRALLKKGLKRIEEAVRSIKK